MSKIKGDFIALKNHEERLDKLEKVNISGEESETLYKRNGKRVYVQELQYNISTSIFYNANINITNLENVWIDYANSYIDTNSSVRLPLSQYHNENDWNRVYLSGNNKIYIEFGTTYSEYSKIAHIVILYTKE